MIPCSFYSMGLSEEEIHHYNLQGVPGERGADVPTE